MNVEEYIVARTNALLHAEDAQIVGRLEGGMSNYTYIVECNGRKYTYRVPGKHAELFVDRQQEWHNIQEVEPLGLNNEHSYVETATGEKLADYVEGTILSTTDIVPHCGEVAKALHRLHESCCHFEDYNAFGRLDDDERYCTENGFRHPEEYYVLRHKLEEMQLTHKGVKKVPCHCDFQPSNIVIGNDRVYILDWEFAGMNDPIYDIACFGNAGFDVAVPLLEAYVGHKPTKEEMQRLYYHSAFQCLQWYNLAIYKDRIGLSQDLNIDFDAAAGFFFGSARDLIALYEAL